VATADALDDTTSDPDPKIELSVVMPCLNEAETLETCIRKAAGCLERLGSRRPCDAKAI
jgi:hypothetical protein